MRLTRLCSILTLLTVLGLLTVPAQAALCTPTSTPCTMTDKNSTLVLDPTSQSGAYNWIVDGVDNLYQQWFWYRIGDGLQASIDTLPLISENLLGPSYLQLSYGNAQLTIDVTYILSGGNLLSHSSDVGEQISISNDTDTALDLHFFQYSDFDLNGVSGGQTVTFLNTNTMRQTGAGIELSETTDVPAPNEHEANTYANTLNSLNTVPGYNLNNQNTATGDATWAFQWDTTLAANGSFQISKDKLLSPLVPEPATIFGLGAVLLLVGSRLRKRVRA